ncbi:MAG: retropepsin-like aspartic protease [Bacillota bacterium]
MKHPINIKDNLPFVQLKIIHNDKELLLDNVLIDTGSAKSILKENLVETINIKPEPEDILGSVRRVGGVEYVYIKQIDLLELNGISIKDFEVDIGEMDYGFEINGIIGMDFLLETNSIIDLNNLIIKTKEE